MLNIDVEQNQTVDTFGMKNSDTGIESFINSIQLAFIHIISCYT